MLHISLVFISLSPRLLYRSYEFLFAFPLDREGEERRKAREPSRGGSQRLLLIVSTTGNSSCSLLSSSSSVILPFNSFYNPIQMNNGPECHSLIWKNFHPLLIIITLKSTLRSFPLLLRRLIDEQRKAMMAGLRLPLFLILSLHATDAFLVPHQGSRAITAPAPTTLTPTRTIGPSRLASSTSDDEVTTDWRKDFA